MCTFYDPTLQDVTDAGAVTTDDITTGDILVNTTTTTPNVVVPQLYKIIR